MFTFNQKSYTDFNEFATEFATEFDNVDFSKFITINKQVDNITSDNVASVGVYEINGKKFAISKTFEGVETTANGNTNKRKRRLVKFENSDEIKRFDDITQLKRILGAATGQNPSGIKCGKSKKVNLQNATFENIATLKAQLANIMQQLDVLKEVADVHDCIAQINTAVRNVWAYQLQAQRKQEQKNNLMQKLQGLTPEQLAKVMALLK